MLRLSKDGIPYAEAQGYETEKYADLRIKHLLELDNAQGVKQLITPPDTHTPPDMAEARQRALDEVEREYRELTSRQGATGRQPYATVGHGEILLNYGPQASGPAPSSLGSYVARAWSAWRDSQAAQGNLEEAAQEPPPIPPELFEERQGQLALFPRGLA